MAWPLTPFRSMIDGSTYWDAALGNALQSGVNGIVAGTYSLAAVVVDGTGGATVAPVTGTMKLSASAQGTSTPTPSFTPGLFYKDTGIGAAVRFNANGGTLSFTRGINIASGVRNSVGNFTFTLSSTIAESGNSALILCSTVGAGFSAAAYFVTAYNSNATTLNVFTFGSNGTTATDPVSDVCAVVFSA